MDFRTGREIESAKALPVLGGMTGKVSALGVHHKEGPPQGIFKGFLGKFKCENPTLQECHLCIPLPLTLPPGASVLTGTCLQGEVFQSGQVV